MKTKTTAVKIKTAGLRAEGEQLIRDGKMPGLHEVLGADAQGREEYQAEVPEAKRLSHIPEFESSGSSPGRARTVRKPAGRALPDLLSSPLTHKQSTTVQDTPDVGAVNEPPGVISPPEKEKRGRPRKHANNAAKTAAYRLRKKEKQQNIERSKLVAELMKTVKSELPTPSKNAVDKIRIRANNKQRLRNFERELVELTLEDLQCYKETLELYRDSAGRLRNERSGEKPRANGLSEIEMLKGMQEAEEIIGGRRVTPAGFGPDVDEIDESIPGEGRKAHDRPVTGVSEKAIIISTPVCSIPDCGQLAAIIHPQDRQIRLSHHNPPRFLCNNHGIS